jgi:capsular polysaccharide biosynthesis protein
MNYINRLKLYKNMIVKICLAVVVLAVVVSLFMPQQYRAQTKLLIIQHQSLSLDAYLAAKSAEKVSKVLSEVVHSSSFFDEIWQAGFNIGSDWGQTDKQRRKLWEKRVDLNSISQTSLIEVNTYHTDRASAEQLAQAMIYVLVEKGAQYHGGGDQVEIKLIDKPIVSNYPVRPNLVQNAISALLIGLVISFMYVYLKPDRQIEAASKPLEEYVPQANIQHEETASYLTPKE